MVVEAHNPLLKTITYKCVETIYQLPKSKDMVKT